MEGCAATRLLTWDKISIALRFVEACADAICSTTRGVSTCSTRSSLASSVNPSAVSALSSAASSSASVAGAIADPESSPENPPRFRFRSGVTVPTCDPLPLR